MKVVAMKLCSYGNKEIYEFRYISKSVAIDDNRVTFDQSVSKFGRYDRLKCINVLLKNKQYLKTMKTIRFLTVFKHRVLKKKKKKKKKCRIL